MNDDTAIIEQAVDSWVRAWSARESKTVLSLWDNQDPEARYLPAEQQNPLIGSAAITDYVATTCDLFSAIEHRAEGILARRLSPSLGLVFYTLNWMLSDNRGPIGGMCRVTALWRHHENQWRLFHYAEAPLAPLLELQAYYESIAAEGLDAIPQRDLR